MKNGVGKRAIFGLFIMILMVGGVSAWSVDITELNGAPIQSQYGFDIDKLSFQLTGLDPSDINNVWFSDDGGATLTPKGYSESGGIVTLTGLSSNQDDNDWMIRVEDTSFVTNEDTISFWVDSLDPIITVNTPSSDPFYTNSNLFSVISHLDETNPSYYFPNKPIKFLLEGPFGYSKTTYPNIDASDICQESYSVSDEGEYTYTLTTGDSMAHSDTKQGTIIFDSTAPTVTIVDGTETGPVQTDTINLDADDVNLKTISLEYGYSPDNVCDVTDIYGNSFTDSTDFSISGDHIDYLCAVADDLAGNTAYQLVGQLNTDNTAPTVFLVTISDAIITDADTGTQITIDVDFSEPMDQSINPTITFVSDIIASGTLTFDSGSWTDVDTYKASYNVFDVNEEVLDVDVSINSAQDIAGNSQTSYTETDAIDVDTKNPTVSITSTETSPTNANPIPITITFSEEVVGFTESDILIINGIVVLGSLSTSDNIIYTFDVTPTTDDLVTVDIAEEVAQDLAGNGNVVATQFSITSDPTAPNVVINSPSSSQIVTTTEIIIFTDNELTNPECSIDNTAWVSCVSGTTTLGNVTGFGILPDGTFNLYLRDTDTAGNVGTDSEVGIIKDTTAPVFISVNDAGDGNYMAGELITFDVDLGEIGLTVTADLSILDSDFSISQALTDEGDGTYSFTTSALDNSGNMQEGLILITFTAQDSVGNVAQDSSLSLELDKTSPTITDYLIEVQGLEPSNKDVVYISPGNSFGIQDGLNLSINSNEIVDWEIRIKDSGGVLATSSVWTKSSSNSVTKPFSCDLWNGTSNQCSTLGGNLAEGNYTIEVTLTDTVGNVFVDSTKNITIDNTNSTNTTEVLISISTNSATFSFTADESSNLTVSYNSTSGENGNVSSSTFSTSHNLEVSGLSSGTEYLFSLTLCDEAGNCGPVSLSDSSSSSSFTTSSPPSSSSGGGSGGGSGSSGSSSSIYYKCEEWGEWSECSINEQSRICIKKVQTISSQGIIESEFQETETQTCLIPLSNTNSEEDDQGNSNQEITDESKGFFARITGGAVDGIISKTGKTILIVIGFLALLLVAAEAYRRYDLKRQG